MPAMASIMGMAEEQKSFGSFLKKRTCFHDFETNL